MAGMNRRSVNRCGGKRKAEPGRHGRENLGKGNPGAGDLGKSVTNVFTGLLFVGLLGAVMASGHHLYQRIDQPFTEVRVGGDFHYLKRQELVDLVVGHADGDFLSIDLGELQAAMQAHPWIADVSVRRGWPSTLEVEVVEETPIARWGEEGFLNRLGEELLIEDTSELVGLPVLKSRFGSSREMMRHYQLLAQMLNPAGLKVVELHRDDLGAWRVVTDQHIELILGRGTVADKIKRLSQVWIHGLNQQAVNIDSIDLRYPNGLAVAWKSEALSWRDGSGMGKNGAAKTAKVHTTRSVQG